MAMKQQFKTELVNAAGRSIAHLADDEVPKFQVKTLGELGPNLPVGVMANGVRVRPFRVRPYKMKQEKALAKLREDVKGGTIGRFVCDALAMMLHTVGPHNFDNMKDNERQLMINQLPMPDVLYMYLYLRYEALGNEPVVMNIKCPACSNEYRWYGDLSSMDIKVVPHDDGDLVRSYMLRDSFEMRGKQCKTLKLGLIKWDAFCRPEFMQKNTASTATIAASIVGADNIETPVGAFQLASNDLDDMTKYDMSGLTADIEANTPGPQLDVDPVCPGCNHSQRMMLDWSWDNFFSRSAHPTRGM